MFACVFAEKKQYYIINISNFVAFKLQLRCLKFVLIVVYYLYSISPDRLLLLISVHTIFPERQLMSLKLAEWSTNTILNSISAGVGLDYPYHYFNLHPLVAVQC